MIRRKRDRGKKIKEKEGKDRGKDTEEKIQRKRDTGKETEDRERVSKIEGERQREYRGGQIEGEKGEKWGMWDRVKETRKDGHKD